jgi:ribosomal protein L37AE/L43A
MKKFLKFLLKYYGDSDYCCPKCGTPSSECEHTEFYTYICSNCGTEFETPDT